jgi:hypothetical protein
MGPEGPAEAGRSPAAVGEAGTSSQPLSVTSLEQATVELMSSLAGSAGFPAQERFIGAPGAALAPAASPAGPVAPAVDLAALQLASGLRKASQGDISGTPRQVCSCHLRTGTCASGNRCKFLHPADRPAPVLNSRGAGKVPRPRAPRVRPAAGPSQAASQATCPCVPFYAGYPLRPEEHGKGSQQ